MSYICPVCRDSFAKWLANDEHFECPHCNSLLTSNRKKTLKQSFVVALMVWLLVLIGVQYYSGSWGYAAVVSIEAGGILAAMLAVLYYRLVIKIYRANKTTVKSVQDTKARANKQADME